MVRVFNFLKGFGVVLEVGRWILGMRGKEEKEEKEGKRRDRREISRGSLSGSR